MASLASFSDSAVIIDFKGGTAYLADGSTWMPSDATDGAYVNNVDYYIEDGVRVDFIGGTGIIGDYYSTFGNAEDESVIHAYWDNLLAVEFSMVDGSAIDLNYVEISSNTTVGGGATGDEDSHITASTGSDVLLPSSDWGTLL